MGELNMREAGLLGSLPNSIGALTALTFMSFSITEQISGTLPEAIGALTALSTLRFDRTHISGSIPQSFCGLHKFNPNQGCLLSYNQYGSVANNYLCPLPTCANVAACGVTTCSTPAPSPA